jgi:hypothetical protein
MAVSLAGCAGIPLDAHTPSGRSEAIFDHTMTGAVGAKLAGWCLDNRFVIQDQTPNQVRCSTTMNPGEALLMLAVTLNVTATQVPTRNVQFSMFQDGDGVRVQAYQWIEISEPFGQTQRNEITAPQILNEMQRVFAANGGHWP